MFWSPYYKIHYDPQNGGIRTNNIGHQGMVRVGESGAAYVLPHLLNRDAGGQPFEDVLIIGAGSGNDVQAALSHGAKHIDAVEIDPVLYEIGRNDHPNQPYADPRVTIHLDDGRSFVRKTSQTYDLIVYALVDSLVLHSGYSSLRLESFLFTEQAFQDVKAKLKPGGIFAMYNWYRQGWVVGRLEKMAEKTLAPSQWSSRCRTRTQLGLRIISAGTSPSCWSVTPDVTVVDAIRKRLVDERFFWVHTKASYNQAINTTFGPEPPAETGTQLKDWQKIGMATVDTTGIDKLPSDDWPFLYLREPMVPGLNIRGMLVVTLLSLVILVLFTPSAPSDPTGRCSF